MNPIVLHALVRMYLEQFGESRFTLIPSVADVTFALEGSRTARRAGYRRRLDNGEGREYMIFPQIWRNDLCKGFDPGRVARLLDRKGLLIGVRKGHPAAMVRVPGEENQRLYRVSSAILCGDDEEGIGAA
jgi:putative DNA primase/helicase